MKLYTEEQVRKAYNDGCWKGFNEVNGCWKGLNEVNGYWNGFNEVRDKENDIINSLTPIELPSDEEIGKDIGSGMHDFYKGGFIEGAKWMRDKIQGGNK
jgi:hypothetical protein